MAAVEERFRRLVLDRLRRAERLSGSFHETLLAWEHSGFSVHAGEAIPPGQPESLERLARYMTRAPVALSKLFPQRDGRVKLLTPRNPETGQDSRLFDPLEWIHAITTQIPDPRQQLVRYLGAYANRVRRLYRPDVGEKAGRAAAPTRAAEGEAEDVSGWVTQRRRSWARLLRRIYEVDPLVCPPCGEALEVVSLITDPVVVDRILAHRREKQIESPLEPRAPPS